MSVAAAAASLVASTSLSVPDHLRRFRRPPPPLRFPRRRQRDRLVLSVLEEQASSSGLTEEEARKFGLNGSAGRVGYDDAAVEAYLASNGNGNGNGSGSRNGATVKPAAASSGSSVSVVSGGPAPGEDERRRKKRVEEISQEDAWFKRSDGDDLPKVSVVPGGRWNRFKTYSTIQRTLEIWGSVFSFIFKVWLNNQKFTYRGGMTEDKRKTRRKVLAKWLKESILRLGPTFIKIGQQFSTRVDILPQEYVDQLSELQDQVPPFPSETAVSTIEEELGASVNEIFDRFDFEPIAAASLGSSGKPEWPRSCTQSAKAWPERAV